MTDTEEAEVSALLKLQAGIESELSNREADDPYPFVDSHEKSLRCFVLGHLGNSEIAGEILIANMEMVYRWIQSGDLPKKKRESLSPQ